MDISVLLPLFITAVGAYFLVKLRFFFIIHPIRALGATVRSFGKCRGAAVRSLSLALAGTLGVGNITGVAVGIIVGGAGSVFWLFISCIFASVLKYAESVLTADNLSLGGGMMYIVKSSFRRLGSPLSALYAALCILLSFTMGAALQTNTVTETAEAAFGISPIYPAAVMLVLVLLGVVGGGERIEKITVFLVPLTTIIYIILTFSVVMSNFAGIGKVLRLILSSAFLPESAVGGVIGFLTSKGIREGYARGILSNEAGAGTSSLAHSRNRDATPVGEGMLGMCEVFFDTALLCMLTAFAILLSVDFPEDYSSGMSLVLSAASSVFGSLAKAPLLFSVFSFAYSTVICWYYYGLECTRFLLGSRGRTPYFILFMASVTLGALSDTAALIKSVDVFLLSLTSISLLTLLKNSDRVVCLSENENIIAKREFSKALSRRRR